MAMMRPIFFIAALVGASSASLAQDKPADPGRDLVMQKCAQCHTDSIWRDQRQNAAAWEATAYRMMARGSIWTTEEVKTMAAFLGREFGPDVPRAKPQQR
jgi:hypothetical protein